MQKLKPGDRIKLFGGYDMDTPWLKGRQYYYATVLRFINNMIEGRSGDERLSAVIEFDDEFEYQGLTGKFSMIMGRWEGQKWDTQGVVHVYLLAAEITSQAGMTQKNSRWMESHANYEIMPP